MSAAYRSLSALVINAADGEPGRGFFDLARGLGYDVRRTPTASIASGQRR